MFEFIMSFFSRTKPRKRELRNMKKGENSGFDCSEQLKMLRADFNDFR